MSGQLFKISAACGAIVLGAVVVGSQLSTGGNFANLVKATEEDEAGVIESDATDDADARTDDGEEADQADEGEAEEDVAEEEVASEGSEGDEADEVAADEDPAGPESDDNHQQADSGSAGYQDGDVIYNGRPVEPGSDD